MPVATARKIEALRADFRSASQVADLLGVSRSQITRWLRGAGIDPLNAERVDLLELVWSSLLRVYDREAALSWLFGINPRLGDRRPRSPPAEPTNEARQWIRGVEVQGITHLRARQGVDPGGEIKLGVGHEARQLALKEIRTVF